MSVSQSSTYMELHCTALIRCMLTRVQHLWNCTVQPSSDVCKPEFNIYGTALYSLNRMYVNQSSTSMKLHCTAFIGCMLTRLQHLWNNTVQPSSDVCKPEFNIYEATLYILNQMSVYQSSTYMKLHCTALIGCLLARFQLLRNCTVHP